MNVVQINGSYGSADSTGRNVKELHLWLKQHGHSSTVYVARINDGRQRDVGVQLYSSASERRVHAILSRIFGLQGYFSQKGTKKLIRNMERDKPEVVLLHVLHNNSINFPLLCDFLARKDIPTILVLHDCWYFTGHCCHYTEAECDQWKADCAHCPQIHQWNPSWFCDTAGRCLKDKQAWFSKIPRLGVVGVSEWITGEARQSILKNAKVLKRIYNWIDMDIFKPQDTSGLREELNLIDTEAILLGVASRWSNQKGLAELLMIAQNHPDTTVILVGETPTMGNWPKNILRIGSVWEPQRLAKFYALADVFLNPSKQETFGKTTAEAICCGTPVVAYDTTACTELVQQECGILVKNGDMRKYENAVQKTLAQGKSKYQAACLSFAHENFSIEHSIRAYVFLFESLQLCNEGKK